MPGIEVIAVMGDDQASLQVHSLFLERQFRSPSLLHSCASKIPFLAIMQFGLATLQTAQPLGKKFNSQIAHIVIFKEFKFPFSLVPLPEVAEEEDDDDSEDEDEEEEDEGDDEERCG